MRIYLSGPISGHDDFMKDRRFVLDFSDKCREYGEDYRGYLHDAGLAMSAMADMAPDNAFDRAIQEDL